MAETSSDASLSGTGPAQAVGIDGLIGSAGRSRAGLALRQDAMYRRTLATVDVLAGTIALLVSQMLVSGHRVSADALLVFPLLVLIAQPIGLYRRDAHVIRKTTLEEAPALFEIATLYALLASLLAPMTMQTQLDSGAVFVLWGLLFVLMLVGRAVDRSVLQHVAPPERCLVIGDAQTARLLRRKFEVSFSVKAIVIGRVGLGQDAQPPGDDGGPSDFVMGSLPELDETLLRLEVDRAIVVPGDAEQTSEAIRIVRAHDVKLSVLPRMLEAMGPSFELDDVDGVMMLGVRRSGLTRPARAVKRSIDVVAAAAGLLILSPVFLAIAAAIKLTSPGPVLFRQLRVGRHSRDFQMLKFRSMVDGADARKDELLALNETEGLFKIANDPRVTPVGRFLRRTSLDELPQLLNVMRGQMSLVGPRPLVPDDDVKIEGWYRDRLNVTPGMTGVWQILGSTRVPLEEMVKLDYLYAVRWSFWLDVKILLRTLAYVAHRRSA
jgi:exopolysaccharide biosynthesis polyprenyl glycosylphosphotransferase